MNRALYRSRMILCVAASSWVFGALTAAEPQPAPQQKPQRADPATEKAAGHAAPNGDRPNAAQAEVQGGGSEANSYNGDTIGIQHVTMYDAGGIYWDRESGQLVVARTRGDADTRLAVIQHNGAEYTFKGVDGATRALTLTGGNDTLYIDTSTVDRSNVTLDDIQVLANTPKFLTDNQLGIAQLVYGNAINSRIIKDYKMRSSTDPSIMNIVRYSAKTVTYDPATHAIAVVGTDLPQDDRILIFDNCGVTYTMKGNAGSSVIRPLDGTSGNQYLCIDRTTIVKKTFSVADMFFKAAPAPNHIICGRLVWNTALNSDMVKIASALPGAASAAPAQRFGEGALFMAGKLPAEKQVFKLAVYGDSIYASGFKDIPLPDANGLGRYEQPPRNTNLDGIQRYIYDYLNFNKPKFRNVMHADWTKAGVGANHGSAVMPCGNAGGVGAVTQWEQLWKMQDTAAGNTAEITITGNSTVVVVFEGGAVGTDEETGEVSVSVSVDGGEFVKPSTVLSGRLTNRGFGETKVYAAAQDSFATSFRLPEGCAPNPYNKNAPMVELYYNGLNPASIYRFRIAKAAAEKRAVKLWGVYHFSGQTLLVTNESKPGFSWGWLATTCYGDLVVSGTDFVLIEAPMYHDNYLLSEQVTAAAMSLLSKIRGYGMQVALCSCPPGGVIPAGRATAILGDASGSAYQPGQHFAKYYDFFYNMKTTDIQSPAESPLPGDVYAAVVNGSTYQFLCVNSESPAPTSYTYFQGPPDFQGFGTMPVTFTQVSGKGKAAVSYASSQHGMTMAQHRDVMQRLALSEGFAFVDVYQAFVNVARSVGEDIYTDGYDMDARHPLYATVQAMDADNAHYPALAAPYKMNYLTNFFDIGDGHHLANPAHAVIFEAVKNTLLKKSTFRQ